MTVSDGESMLGSVGAGSTEIAGMSEAINDGLRPGLDSAISSAGTAGQRVSETAGLNKGNNVGLRNVCMQE